MGGGRPRASTSGRAAPRTLQDASTLPSFLRRQEPALAAAITKAPHWCKVTTVNHTANLPTAAQRARRAAAALTRFGGGGGGT